MAELRCFSCDVELGVQIIWLQDDAGQIWPFCKACSEKPWPMHEVKEPTEP